MTFTKTEWNIRFPALYISVADDNDDDDDDNDNNYDSYSDRQTETKEHLGKLSDWGRWMQERMFLRLTMLSYANLGTYLVL